MTALPRWEAIYEPGNVSSYLIGYLNDEGPAKAAAEDWLEAQTSDVLGELRWDFCLTSGEYDAWWQLAEICEGVETDTGMLVRHHSGQSGEAS